MQTQQEDSTSFAVSASAPGFGPVPYRIIDDPRITDGQTVAVYVALTRFIDYGTAQCFPSYATIGQKARCSADTAQRHIATLLRLGYVRKVSGKAEGRSNRYHLNDPWGREQAPEAPAEAPAEGRVPVTEGGEGTAPVRQGYRTGAAGGTAPVPDERDLENDTHEGESTDTLPSFVSLIEEMRKEAKELGIPTGFITTPWSSAVRSLSGEVSHGSILTAFRTCLANQPEKACFFAQDFSRWMRIANDELVQKDPKPMPTSSSPSVEELYAKYAPADEDIDTAEAELRAADLKLRMGNPLTQAQARLVADRHRKLDVAKAPA